VASTITVRNLDEKTQLVLRHRAVDHGRSFEAEIREILEEAARSEPAEPTNAEILFEAARKFREAAAEVGGFTMPERIVEYQRDVIL